MQEEKAKAPAFCAFGSKKRVMKKLPCLHFDEPCGIQVGAGVVALVQGADDDTAGGAGVDELPVAQVDAYMADTAAAGGKEHQVAELEVGLLDIGAGRRGHVPPW